MQTRTYKCKPYTLQIKTIYGYYDMENVVAIWINKKKDDKEKIDIQIDINIWASNNKNSLRYKDYIEFGIKIVDNPNLVKNINIYLPYQISIKDIEDIVPKLKCIDTLNALFNEKMNIKTLETSGLYSVNSVNNSKKFIASTTYINRDDIKSIVGGGCIIQLKIPTIDKDEPINLYKRIRINKIDGIISRYSENNFFVDGLFKEMRIIEINVNSIRRLPQVLIDKINFECINIKKINLYLMADISANMVFCSKDIKNSRILEEDIWNNYLNIESSEGLNKIVAYRWLEDNNDNGEEKNIDNYGLFVKMSLVTKGKIIIIAIILIIILNLVSNWLYNKF